MKYLDYPPDPKKQKHHSSGRAFLQKVRKLLGHPDAVIRHCKGGPAVMGEITMRGPGYYVCLAYSWLDDCGYMRRATEQNPYGTGMDCPNITILPAWRASPEAFVEAMRKCRLIT